ncbi:hypothetical protein EDD21DRAFT_80734 [Dissophora ornata]|nr:hypothetical protein EDD21DRAFT_80734 [Dissophora ornata]
MARRLLHLVRFLLLLLSTTVFMSSLFLIVKNHIVFQSAHWTVWVPFIIAFASDIIFWYSLRKRNCVPSMFRNLFLSLLSLAWFVTPSYHIHALLELHGGSQFLQYWSCGYVDCSLLMASEICGMAIGLIAVVEMTVANRYEHAPVQNQETRTTSIFIRHAVPHRMSYSPLEQQGQQQPIPLHPYLHLGYDQSKSLDPPSYYPQPADTQPSPFVSHA